MFDCVIFCPSLQFGRIVGQGRFKFCILFVPADETFVVKEYFNVGGEKVFINGAVFVGENGIFILVHRVGVVGFQFFVEKFYCLVVVGLHVFFAVFFSVLNQISLETVACQTFGTVVFDNFVASVNQSVDSGSSNDLELQFEVVLFVFSGFLGTIFFQTYDIGRIDCGRTGVSRIKIDVKVEKDVLHGEGGSV